MAEKLSRIVLDTNILVSAIVFGGRPRFLLLLALNKQFVGITSSILLAELSEVLSKKFNFNSSQLKAIESNIKSDFHLVYPTKHLAILKDEPDNRVLEAALAGDVNFIITGDKALLELKKFREIKITTIRDFYGF